MNTGALLNLFAFCEIAVALALVVRSIAYLRAQKRVCREYPFFRFRDEVIWMLVQGNRSKKCLALYKMANFMIKRHEHYSFAYFNRVARGISERIFAIEPGDHEALRRLMKKIDPTDPVEQKAAELLKLLLVSARQNSLLMRLAMTKLGFWLLFSFHFIRGIRRLGKEKADTIEFYSCAAHYVAYPV